MNETPSSRRRFLVNLALAASAVPLGARLLSGNAMAQSLPALPLDNPQAKALAYAEDAAAVKHPSFKAGSDCANCQFFQGAPGASEGPCALFPGHSVKAKGWCSAWAKKA